MKVIDNMLSLIREEMDKQPSVLASFLASSKPGKVREGSILVGAGDSYAAALCSASLCKHRILAMDPYSLCESPEVAGGRDVYFISVSGRTRSNIAAARRVSRICRRAVAITADEASPLAAQVDRTIRIPHTPLPKAPGTLTFSLVLLTAVLLTLQDVRCDFRRAYSKAKSLPWRPGISDSGITYFLGNHAAYGISVYAAAKVYEFLGGRAQAELLEEFSHTSLFSLSRSDHVNVFPQYDSRRVGQRLCRSLNGSRYSCSVLPSRGSNSEERLFHSVFLVQLGVLERAEKRGFTRPYFLDAERLLRTSDAMIY